MLTAWLARNEEFRARELLPRRAAPDKGPSRIRARRVGAVGHRIPGGGAYGDPTKTSGGGFAYGSPPRAMESDDRPINAARARLRVGL